MRFYKIGRLVFRSSKIDGQQCKNRNKFDIPLPSGKGELLESQILQPGAIAQLLILNLFKFDITSRIYGFPFIP